MFLSVAATPSKHKTFRWGLQFLAWARNRHRTMKSFPSRPFAVGEGMSVSATRRPKSGRFGSRRGPLAAR